MRAATQAKIDALHAEIADLIDSERRWYDTNNPDATPIQRSIAHTRLRQFEHSPQWREISNMVAAAKMGTPAALATTTKDQT